MLTRKSILGASTTNTITTEESDLHGERIVYLIKIPVDDFTGISDMLLLFGESTQSVSVNISIADDTIFEGTEIFQASLTLVDPFNPTVITVSPSLANISIEDDDSKSTLTLQYDMVLAEIALKAA